VKGISHLTDEPILIDRPSLLPIGLSRNLSPHLLNVFENHVAMPVECLYTREKLAVIAAGNKDLIVRTNGGL